MTIAPATPATADIRLGTAAAFGALLSVNTGASLAKHLFPLLGAGGVTALRTVLAAALLCAITRPWRRRLPPGLLPGLLTYGVVLGLMNLSFYQAIARIPLGIAIAIEVTGPLAIAVLGSRSRRDLLWLAMAIGGLLLLLPLRAQDTLDPVGILFAFGAAVCWALYIVAGKQVAGPLGRDAVAWGLAIAGAITLPIGVAGAGTLLLAPWALLLGLGMAVLSSALPYSLEMEAMRRSRARPSGC